MFGNGLLKKRWENNDFHEEGGESINMVRKRNMEALGDKLLSIEEHCHLEKEYKEK